MNSGRECAAEFYRTWMENSAYDRFDKKQNTRPATELDWKFALLAVFSRLCAFLCFHPGSVAAGVIVNFVTGPEWKSLDSVRK